MLYSYSKLFFITGSLRKKKNTYVQSINQIMIFFRKVITFWISESLRWGGNNILCISTMPRVLPHHFSRIIKSKIDYYLSSTHMHVNKRDYIFLCTRRDTYIIRVSVQKRLSCRNKISNAPTTSGRET